MTRSFRRPSMSGCLVCAAWLLSSSPAVADGEPAPASSVAPGPIVASVVPGVLVHGTGHFVAGKSGTGYRLLAAEGAGVGLVLAGGLPLVLSGANRYIVAPAAALVATGVGLFAGSFLADVYGVAVPGAARGRPLPTPPLVEATLGYRFVYDPVFDYRNFLHAAADLRFRQFRLQPEFWSALDEDTTRARVLAAFRAFGAQPRRAAPLGDGSFGEVQVALTHHRQSDAGFVRVGGETLLAGRLDLQRVDPQLRGAFAELALGWGYQVVDFEPVGGQRASDPQQLLLIEIGLGAYIGRGEPPYGEVELYYDHRHDDYAAGLKLEGLGSGVLGHFGLRSELFLSERWGLTADLQAGSAYVLGASVSYRYGATP